MKKVIEYLKKIFGVKKVEINEAKKTNSIPEVDVVNSDKEKFEKAMKFIRVVEGGKFFHSNDPGGFTNMGLTQRDYPNLDLPNLTRKQADNIFYKDYWKKSVAGKLPDPVFISYFDAVVNTGVSRANKILQKVVGVEVDGKVGPATLKAVNNYESPKKLALKLADGKQDFYLSLVNKNRKFASFIRGWTRRTNALKDYITSGAFSW
jgi:lysozyme family protein